MARDQLRMRPSWAWLAAAVAGGWCAAGRGEAPQDPPALVEPAAPPGGEADQAGRAGPSEEAAQAGVGPALRGRMTPLIPTPASQLDPRSQPIDLTTALRLANVQNPDLNRARALVMESVALRQFAAAQILPTLNAGTNYDNHTGVLQQSNGNVLDVNRAAVFVGSGANAVAAGTTNIPGVVLAGNIAQGVYAYLTSRQVVREREFANLAVRNQTLRRVAVGYTELIRAEGRRAIAYQARDEVREVARLTAEYAASGSGRPADANRANTQLANREAAIQQAEAEVVIASARLAQLLNLDPSIRLHPTDAFIVPMAIVPDPIPLAELIALALLRRPELGERRAAIREAMLALEGTKVLPFSPTILIGFSAGGFGGGSNLVRPVFGGFGGRSDFDAVFYWTLRNMGVGNIALIRGADARLRASHYRWLGVLNQVRDEVAEANALIHARFAQIGTYEQAVRAGLEAFREDYARIKLRGREEGAREVLPIELLNSFDLLARSRRQYLDAIVDYNEAQFDLYVAMGQPPAAALSHPVPSAGISPSGIAFPPGGRPLMGETSAPGAAAPNAPGPAANPPGAAAANPPGAAAPNPPVPPPAPAAALRTTRVQAPAGR